MSQVPYLKTEGARDCTRGAQVSVFSFSPPKRKEPKLIMDKLFLTYKLIPKSPPNSQTQENPNSHHIKFPKTYNTIIKHILQPNHRKTNP